VIRTQVAIVGAGPAGLVLSHLLHLDGIESIVVESRSRAYVEERVRAGVLESGTVDLLREAGVGERLSSEGLVHHGIALRFNGRSKRIDFPELTDGKSVVVYGQQEVVKDLIEARLHARGAIFFEAQDVAVSGVDGDRPTVTFRNVEGRHEEIVCDFVAGCDGFHGICRSLIPAHVLRTFERVYPFSWLGILARTAPVSHELIYANHERGFGLYSARSETISRLYIQCRPDEDLAEWPDERVWDELRIRLEGEDAPDLVPGPVLQKGITPMRSFVAEPMQYGRLFLAGDSAHIVPPTGAKGMNLAIADVRVLARALTRYYATGSSESIDRYSQTCLRRVWKTERFSWWMTSMLHRYDPSSDVDFDDRLQMAELDYVTSSRAAAQTLAENYVGLPLEA